MSEQKLPAELAMAEDRGERITFPDGQEVRVLELPIQLPQNAKKRACCEAHLVANSEAEHIVEDFRLAGHDRFLDGSSDLYLQTACAGLSCIAKTLGRDCVLRRRQYDSDGRMVGEIRY